MGLTPVRERALDMYLVDLIRAQWKAAAEVAGEYERGPIHDEMDRRFPEIKPEADHG